MVLRNLSLTRGYSENGGPASGYQETRVPNHVLVPLSLVSSAPIIWSADLSGSLVHENMWRRMIFYLRRRDAPRERIPKDEEQTGCLRQ